jgi:O-antigen/teichoic acid export membrane protein
MASLVSQGVNFGYHLLLLPAFLAVFGAPVYGAWIAMCAGTGLLALLHLGCPDHVINRLTAARARGSEDEYATILHSALGAALALAALGMVGASAVIALLPAESWAEAAEITPATLRACLLLLALQGLSTVPGSLLLGLYRSLEEFPRGIMVSTLQRLTSLVFVLAALATAPSLLLVAIAMVVPALCFPIYAWLDIGQRHPDLPFGLRRARLLQVRSFLGPGLLFLAIEAAALLGQSGPRLVAGWTTGLGTLAVLAAMTTAVNAARQLIACFLTPLWPESTSFLARGKLAALRRMHRLGTKAALALTLPIVSLFALQGRELVHAWTWGRIRWDSACACFLLAQLVLHAFSITGAICAMSWSRHGPVARSRLLGTALGLATAALLAPRHGLPGLALGLALGEVIPALSIPRWTCRTTGDRPAAFFAQTLGRGALAAAVIGGAATGAAALTSGAPLLLGLPAVALAAFAASAICGPLILLDASERSFVRDTFGWPPPRRRLRIGPLGSPQAP